MIRINPANHPNWCGAAGAGMECVFPNPASGRTGVSEGFCMGSWSRTMGHSLCAGCQPLGAEKCLSLTQTRTQVPSTEIWKTSLTCCRHFVYGIFLAPHSKFTATEPKRCSTAMDKSFLNSQARRKHPFPAFQPAFSSVYLERDGALNIFFSLGLWLLLFWTVQQYQNILGDPTPLAWSRAYADPALKRRERDYVQRKASKILSGFSPQ
ncbi:PREDICTED: uncharacterized protein LOC108445492 isoform X1 [Corvus brachyrhynchos]|uniref:uncharacterized protein LOC108445492 isoform X1 n=2 Tax=Corvus brachyrhynchos TaxID=85066 RepID=UPI0008165D45|nr:PREDICTED: uncharacterized protein LOC108445492 isoform X1 [Corvus brachyrhynchos]